MSLSLNELNAQFGLPALKFIAGQGGLTCAAIDNGQSIGEVYLHGAHVTQFQPRQSAPVLWMSKATLFETGKAIRGGIPICFPWFGPHPQLPATAPAHGWARISDWSVQGTTEESTGATQLVLGTCREDVQLTYTMTFGRELELEFTVMLLPQAPGPMEFEEALHTYLNVADIREAFITGLESASYIDKVDASNTKPASGKTVSINGECDRVYLDTVARCELHDSRRARTLFIEKTNSFNTVVWNPWIAKSERMTDFGNDEWPGLVCIETANIGARAVMLRPGESHTLAMKLGIKI